MKKEDFVKLGLDEENAKKCADASAEELKGYIPKNRFDEVNNEKHKLELEVRDRDGQLEALKNSTGDIAEMKKQIDDLQKENTKKEKEHVAEIKALKIETALETALTGVKAKNNKAVKALLDLDKAELNDDGTIKGLAEQLEKLTKEEDSKFLFEAETEAKPKVKGAKPADSKAEKPDSAVDFSKMTYEELSAYMSENPDVQIPTNYN